MKVQRLEQEQKFIEKYSSVTIEQLCEEFKISKNTVRRDIAELIEMGKVEKVYGGVVAKGNVKEYRMGVRTFDSRTELRTDVKLMLGEMAASYVEDNDVIFLDSGTTTIHMVPHLKNVHNLTVVTHSIPAVAELYKLQNIRVIVPPGSLFRPTFSVADYVTVDFLSKLNINKAFMASTGVSWQFDVTNATMVEYGIKRCVMERSQERFLLVDSAKFGTVGIMSWAKLKQFDRVITDEPVPARVLDYLKENQVKYN